MSQALYYVGIDVGGSSIKGGVVDDSGRPLSSVSLETEAHKGQDHGLGRMAETVVRSVQSARLEMAHIAAIGVATPGTMDIPAGIMIEPPNLKPWKNVPVRQFIQDRFQKPTAFQNDANAAAFGEYWIGAGKDAHSMVLFTLGTGIGGGIIIDHKVIEGEHSHGAEIGHTRIELTNPRVCGCGGKGCLEAYASALSVVKRAVEALARDSGASALHQVARNKSELSARDIFVAAAAGDKLADLIVEDTAFYLAVGATNMMHVIDPDMIVYAGGMTAAGDSFLERIKRHVRQLALPVPAARTEVRFAILGGDAGFIGAAGCARQLVSQQAH